jgi:wyosine [tRNA(Phe)-imidazoG37] synthetase (radical SAM superfamily)
MTERPNRSRQLNARDHSRDNAHLLYVYPVVSRRAGGVSVGVNLNPNNACNWRCVYCQVPELKRGAAPRIDLPRLESELRGFIAEVLHGSFMEERVPPEARRLNDIALSGNGEPTTSRQFDAVIELIGKLRAELAVPSRVKLVLITNGSMMDRPAVQTAVARMSALNGEVWYKVDRATREGILRVNSVRASPDRMFENLRTTAGLCPTWIQTCTFQIDAAETPADEREAYLAFLRRCVAESLPLRGVLLYGLARRSMQKEAERLSPLPATRMEALARQIRACGLRVQVNP